jgi:hypothetical protein
MPLLTYAPAILHSQLAAVCPIDGVWIGDPTNAATWGFWPDASATPQQIAAAQAALAAVTPAQLAALNTGATPVTFLQFMALFTPAEQGAIIGSTDLQTRTFIMMATGSGGLQLSNPEVVAGVNYLASISLIAAGRPAQILANQPPA